MAQRRIKTLLIFFVFLTAFFCLSVPAAAERVKVTGDKMTYSVADDLLVISGNAVLITEDATIKADELQAIYKSGQVIEIKAKGKVELIKKDDTFFSTELTYHIKSKTGLILNIEAHANIKDSEEKAYLSGKTAYYSQNMIEIIEGSLSTCDLDTPHYLFKAKRVEFYPEDKIRAWHLSFWEFNGKVPLLYFPYYTFSLKEEDREFTPSLGYSAATGLFLKMVYRYYDPGDQHGEVYLDLFQKMGPAIGIKHYYLDTENHNGSLYLYLQKQDKAKTLPYLTAKHSHWSKWEDWSLTSNTTMLRYGNRDSLSNTNSFGYAKDGKSLKWNSNYMGNYSEASDMRTYYLKNTVQLRWELLGIKLDGDFDDDLQFLQPNGNVWQGNFKAYQNKSYYDWTLMVMKKGNRDVKQNLYTIPELDVRLKFGAWKTPLKPLISPFSYNLVAGRYLENRSEVEAYRLSNRLTFSKDIKIGKPLTLGVNAAGMHRLYSTGDTFYEVTPAVELRTQSFYGLSSNVKYAFRTADGTSPFFFDRLSTHTTEQVTGSLNYKLQGLTLSTSSGYDLRLKTYSALSNSLTYNWGKGNNIQLSVPYNIELKKFAEMSGSVKIKGEELDLSFSTRLDPNDWKFKRVDSTLDWQVSDNWHINLVTSFDPQKGFDTKDSTTRGKIEIVRDLHCREISLSYDAVKKEVWFQYQITAFPKQKVRFGSNDKDPILIDMDLGGLTNGQ